MIFAIHVANFTHFTDLSIWGRLREGAESYAKALASDILR